jgi:histidine ammonia-lyase
LLKTGDAIYGVNTGFGKLAKTRIAAEDLSKLQINIVRSHAAGVGAPLDENVVRLIMLLKINALSQGASGISLVAMEALTALLNAEVLPVIPGQGSVGASGDLAPLAHLSLVLIGGGCQSCCLRAKGRARPSQRHAGFNGACPFRIDRGGAKRSGSHSGWRLVH